MHQPGQAETRYRVRDRVPNGLLRREQQQDRTGMIQFLRGGCKMIILSRQGARHSIPCLQLEGDLCPSFQRVIPTGTDLSL